ncbi:MAG TPA: hypothetical protein VII06_41635 [Chloroflexota bacterium]|jgi:hypothetical protein
MFEIWRDTTSGARYLVALHDTQVIAVAGPLAPREDPARVLALHSNQNHDPWALLDIQKYPDRYRREYTTNRDGRVVPVPDAEAKLPR